MDKICMKKEPVDKVDRTSVPKLAETLSNGHHISVKPELWMTQDMKDEISTTLGRWEISIKTEPTISLHTVTDIQENPEETYLDKIDGHTSNNERDNKSVMIGAADGPFPVTLYQVDTSRSFQGNPNNGPLDDGDEGISTSKNIPIVDELIPCSSHPPISYANADGNLKTRHGAWKKMSTYPCTSKLKESKKKVKKVKNANGMSHTLGSNDDSEMSENGRSEEKLYRCPLCSFSCTHVGNLRRHEKIHENEKPFKCSLCTFSCSRSSNLKTHVKTHTAEKPYMCTVCAYTCRTRKNLESHTITHTGEKPYKCSLCTYTCSWKWSLKRHELAHTGDKPYECHVCSYRCTQKTRLNIHLLIHTGEKPYTCSYCSYRSGRKQHVKSHESRIHTRGKSCK